MNRLTSASTNAIGEGQYAQSYTYDPTTGNLSSKSDVGPYTYAPSHPHAASQAGVNSYGYDQNGNMTSRMVGGIVWTYTYNAENQLVEVRKNNQLVSTYGFDGDGQRVWAKDYDGYLPDKPKLTTHVGNHYEVQVEGYLQPSGSGTSQNCSTPSYCSYLPLVAKSLVENISYYYADGQRIAMKNNGVVSYLYGDQLGSVNAVADGSGALVSKTLYHPWGTTRYLQGITPTDYAYTGQMQEDDIYFYNARWYDPALGRFIQADTFVPTAQGTQGFDRYAYVNNNPLLYTDPSGHRLWEGDAGGDGNWHYDYVMNVLHTPAEREQNARVANVILDVTLTVGSVLFEPMDWAVTASECISGDCSAWALIGLLPYVPGSVGNKVDDFVDIGKHLDNNPLLGQNHHIFSKKVWIAMSDPLKEAFGNNRNSLIVQAVDYAAHHGYQDWHRAVDNELRDFLIEYSPTVPQFIDKLVKEYTPLVNRFPTVLDILQRYR
ncbi:MAG: RHS repeat-associated core domain-containing protein [Anaerolineaceae bacterium]